MLISKHSIGCERWLLVGCLATRVRNQVFLLCVSICLLNRNYLLINQEFGLNSEQSQNGQEY